MAIFNNMRITDKGKILYAKAQAGKELHFTKMRVGAGNVDSRNPDTLLDLIDPKYDVGIQSISPNSETKSATISGMINNGAVKEPTYICEIGLYAEDPDEGEILYGYASAGQYGDYYAPNTVGAFTWNYQVVAAIGNAANVTVELSNLVYDYGVINTNTTFIHLSGGNQKEINKSIDNTFSTIFNSGDYIYYCEASGSLNTYRVTIDEYTKKAYTKGMGIAVLINANSTGASTININGIGAAGIKKANGNDVTNLKANAIYTMRWNGANFILQGEGGSGNATADDILARKTASTDAGDIVGTMIDHEPCTNAVNISGYNPMYVRIPKGAYINSSGSGFPEISIPRDKLINNLGITADIIKKGENICGVNGVLDTNYGDEGFAIEYIKCFKTAYVSYSGGYSPNIDENISSRVVKVNDSEVYIDLDYQPYSINLCFPYSMADSDSRQNRYNDIEVELDTYTKLYLNKTVQCSRDARRYSKDYSSDGGGTHGPYTVYNCTANITLTKINNKYRLQIISNTTWTSERDYKKDKNIIIKEGDTFNGFGAIRIHRVANTIIGI